MFYKGRDFLASWASKILQYEDVYSTWRIKTEHNITLNCPNVTQAYHYHCIMEVTCSFRDFLVHFFLCS